MCTKKGKRPFDLNFDNKFSKNKNILQTVIRKTMYYYQKGILQANSNTKST